MQKPRRATPSSRVEFWSCENQNAVCIAHIPLESYTKPSRLVPNRQRAELQKQALRWSYIVRQRGRWAQDWESQQEMASLAVETLEQLGLDDDALERLGSGTPVHFRSSNSLHCNLIEVRIPFLDESTWWEARVMPWEHLLAAATRSYRGETPLVVNRVLDLLQWRGTKGSKKSPYREPKRFGLAIVTPTLQQSKTNRSNDFEWILESLEQIPSKEVVDSPNQTELRSWLEKWQPELLHLSGMDVRRAAKMLGRTQDDLHDGLALPNNNASCEFLYPQETATLLARGATPPYFVGLNLWDSAARIAPLTVAAGAKQVLAFENSFPDNLAELFFSSFYERLAKADWNSLDAFVHGIAATRPYARRVRGSGFVLWSDESLLEHHLQLQTPFDSKTISPKKISPVALRPDQEIRDWVAVEVEVEPEINYALLHNHQSVLRKLLLRLKKSLQDPLGKTIDRNDSHVDAVFDIQVSVRLYFGNESFPYSTRVGLSSKTPAVNLADPLLEPSELHGQGGIHVPLLSSLPRSLDEGALTSLEVQVGWHDQCLHHQTYPVRLAPIDQWRFEERDILWLPSFVHPRDQAVASIIDSAQRYLTCLRDDTTAGFDGYAAYRSDLVGPDRCKGIVDQVRAIWSTILIDKTLHYINPPPSYSEASQRLRTPSQTIGQGRGTCIDLATLLAACMEWIDLYPVIFLMDDHAFPGYWRDLEAYMNFTEPKIQTDPAPADGRSTNGDSNLPNNGTTTFPWYNSRATYLELRELVHDGSLIPIESVCLTNGEGFATALEVGRRYFESRLPRSFHSMIDIARARYRVTPLPI